MLFDALEHWTANQPAPRKISQAPDPREAIADALAAIGDLDDAQLVSLLRYGGGIEARQAVSDLSRQRWIEQCAFRDTVFVAAERGDLSPQALRKFIEHPVTLTSSQRDAALRLARSKSAAMRGVLVNMFAWPGFLDDTTASSLNLLIEDAEPEIRAAASALCGIPQAVT